MNWFSETVVTLAAITIAIATVAIAMAVSKMSGEVKKMGGDLRKMASSSRLRPELFFAHSESAETTPVRATVNTTTGHAIFVFVGGKWRLQEDFSNPGFEAVPPAMEGAFEGQVVRTGSGLPGEKQN